MKKIIIIGSGIAGMTAAMYLVEAGYYVEIYEARNIIGGRCYSNQLDAIPLTVNNSYNKNVLTSQILNEKIFNIDNGQHLFSGAYTVFFELLKWLDTFDFISNDNNIQVDFCDLTIENNTNHYELNCNPAGSKIGFINALLKMEGISFNEKIVELFFCLYLFINNEPKKDIPLLNFFNQLKLSDNLVKKIWKPLAVSILNTPIENASTILFVNVMKKIISDNKTSLSIEHSKVPLSNLFANFENKLNSTNGKIFFNSKVSELIVENNICKGVIVGKELITSDYIISTLPPKQLSKLDKTFEKYSVFNNSPIISAYIWINKLLNKKKYCACVNANIEWIFDRNIMLNFENEKIYQYAITISAAENLIDLDSNKILEIIIAELKQIFNSDDIKIIAYKIIKDKNATPLITFENNNLRPNSTTEINNFYLAGDWTQTTLPATIESAAISGKNTAKCIINN